MRRSIVLAALLLAACGSREPVNASADPNARPPPPAPTAADFSQDMTARGNEPFWALKMQGTTFTLVRPGETDVVFQAPGATIVPGMGKWSARAADGRTLDVTLYVSDCSDGMSDQRYPMSAELTLANETTLSGCAAKTAELSKAAPTKG
jgi:uncharacterized membrane protein